VEILDEKTKEVLTKDEIFDALKKHRDILLKYKVKEIGLFGSFVRGEQGGKSDIDLFADFEDPSIENFMDFLFLRRPIWKKSRNSYTCWRGEYPN